MYKPKPIDTKQITIPTDIQLLEEILAKNTHEIWAQQRVNQGWRYGAKRNDDKKEHPNLIKYELLSEEDKDYDRNTAREIIKAVISLGYTIKKK